MQASAAVVVIVFSLGVAPMVGAEDEPAAKRADQVEAGAAIDRAERPAALMPLFASYVALQALDIASTYRGLDAGMREANPILGGALNSPAEMIAIKAGSAALTIGFVNHLSKRHPTAAILLMVGVNSAYATIVAHNYLMKH
jgi:hypothetical protein